MKRRPFPWNHLLLILAGTFTLGAFAGWILTDGTWDGDLRVFVVPGVLAGAVIWLIGKLPHDWKSSIDDGGIAE
jgi:hypothetical protein